MITFIFIGQSCKIKERIKYNYEKYRRNPEDEEEAYSLGV
jgi:hypothetical protein